MSDILAEHIVDAVRRVVGDRAKESFFGFLRQRAQTIQEQQTAARADEEPEADAGFGTWSPVEGTPGVTRFTFRDRDAGLRRPDYSDPSLLEGFDGSEADKENWIGHRLIERYKGNPTPEGMENLMAHYDQLIGTTISRFAKQRLPEPAVRGRVYNAFVDAVNEYDSRSGESGKSMQFHNYFMNYPVKGKVKHWADSHRGFAHVPFERAAKHDQVRVTMEQFEMDQGREPTILELSGMLKGIPLNELRRIVPELQSHGVSSRNIRGDYVIDEAALWSRAVSRVRDSLTDEKERAAYEDYFAPVFGKPDSKLSKGAFASKHGISPSKLSKYFKRWKELHNREMDLIGRDL